MPQTGLLDKDYITSQDSLPSMKMELSVAAAEGQGASLLPQLLS